MTGAAIVMTVRNEQDLLRSNVLYHRHRGIGQRSVDRAEGHRLAVRRLPGLHQLDRRVPSQLGREPGRGDRVESMYVRTASDRHGPPWDEKFAAEPR